MTHTRFSRRTRRHPQVESLEGRTLLTAGALDTTFGGTGMVTTTIGTNYNHSNAVAVQPNGQVVVVGSTSGKSTSSLPTGGFTVVRYNTNGSLDSTFGSGGGVSISIGKPSSGYEATAVAIQPSDGKILVAGIANVPVPHNSAAYYSEFALARLNTNGTLDKTFGGGAGYVMAQVAPAVTGGLSTPTSILLRANGQIVVGGALDEQYNFTNFYNGLAMVRYNSNGSLDTTFGTGGEVIDQNLDASGTLAIDSSGRIDGAGYSYVTGYNVVARYLSSGTLDSTFGSGGYAGPLPINMNGIALQSTGQIVIDGGIGSGSTEEAALARLNTDGSLDTTFGTNGVYSESRMTEFDSMVIQPTNNEIVAAGRAWVNGQFDYNFWVTRVLADGSGHDSAFGTSGLSEANFNNNSGSDYPSSVALDPSGNILVTGTAGYHNSSGTFISFFATARFLGGSTNTPAFATATTSSPTATAPNTILGALVPNGPTFLDIPSSGKHRRTI